MAFNNNNNNPNQNDDLLEEIPLTDDIAAGGTGGGIQFSRDVLLYDENGDVATVALAQVDGPNYTVQQHISAQRAS